MLDIGILLTGTIIPNSNFVAVKSPEQRREEYLNALIYYTKFAPVWFCENSDYDLLSDKEFTSIPNLHICKMPVSDKYNQGKGYQEFSMIDKCIAGGGQLPKSFIKVTGRYIINDFKVILEECRKEIDIPLIINLYRRRRFADTYLFYFNVDFYKSNLLNLYEEANDEIGVYIEHVYYHFLVENNINFRMFLHEVNILAVSGSTGKVYDIRPKYKLWLKSFLRNVMSIVGIRILPW